MRIVGISILAIGFISYLGSGIYNIIKPPTLTIFEPQNNITTELRTINISGQTDPEIELSINNELILADNSGAFKKSINLSPGLNILKVKATKKHGSIKEITISVFRKETQVNINNTSSFNQTNF